MAVVVYYIATVFRELITVLLAFANIKCIQPPSFNFPVSHPQLRELHILVVNLLNSSFCYGSFHEINSRIKNLVMSILYYFGQISITLLYTLRAAGWKTSISSVESTSVTLIDEMEVLWKLQFTALLLLDQGMNVTCRVLTYLWLTPFIKFCYYTVL